MARKKAPAPAEVDTPRDPFSPVTFAFTLPDRSVHLLMTSGKTCPQAEAARMIANNPGKYLTYRPVTELPHEAFFEAWRDNGEQITVDIDKARDMHMARIREARNEKLGSLDIETMRHIGNPEKLEEVEARKQALRNLPQTIDLTTCKTPEALAVFIPTELQE